MKKLCTFRVKIILACDWENATKNIDKDINHWFVGVGFIVSRSIDPGNYPIKELSRKKDKISLKFLNQFLKSSLEKQKKITFEIFLAVN